MNRKNRALIAQESLVILERGFYKNNDGKKISIEEVLRKAKENTMLYRPEDFDHILDKAHQKKSTSKTRFEVQINTTLEAAKKLSTQGKVFCLNFASAKNPGGGFLGGSQAQEESLARATGMYPCLLEKQEMYDINRSCRTCLYTDHMIFSPDVPVFRDDHDNLLEDYYTISILTAPAVNKGAVEKNERYNSNQTKPIMLSRTEKVLAVAAMNGYQNLVLGAWGCGVFRNDPKEIAEHFFEHLCKGTFKNVFDHVVFAITSGSGNNFNAFSERFQN